MKFDIFEIGKRYHEQLKKSVENEHAQAQKIGSIRIKTDDIPKDHRFYNFINEEICKKIKTKYPEYKIIWINNVGNTIALEELGD